MKTLRWLVTALAVFATALMLGLAVFGIWAPTFMEVSPELDDAIWGSVLLGACPIVPGLAMTAAWMWIEGVGDD